MKSNSFTTIIIEAEPNHYLTQSDDSIDLKDRIVATVIALGKFDEPSNYKEITKEEGDEIKAQQEQLNKENNQSE